jgi:aryl-alcohol dehydrogenase-like predicted oxidoreductase
MSNPASQLRLDMVEDLAQPAEQAGMTLIELAIAFVTRHPAVTSAIVGPRTLEHLETYLAADGVELSSELLDRIDEIVPPGVTINVADNMWSTSTTALDAASRRR